MAPNEVCLIRLVGPGGAGKTTVGLALANRLGVPFGDLDNQFRTRVGDISAYLGVHGYQAYANQNIQVYLDTLGSFRKEAEFERVSPHKMSRARRISRIT